jgi:hypothetical protein
MLSINLLISFLPDKVPAHHGSNWYGDEPDPDTRGILNILIRFNSEINRCRESKCYYRVKGNKPILLFSMKDLHLPSSDRQKSNKDCNERVCRSCIIRQFGL